MSAPICDERRLCLFARVPILGQVKKRLAASVGDERALEIHRLLVENALERCALRSEYETELWLAGEFSGSSAVARWCDRYAVRPRAQTGDDLGERMSNALAQTLNEGRIPVLIGSDCPHIDADYVLQAFAALDEVDVVLGPAVDGGYGLIGLGKALPVLLENLPWGTDTVLATTLARAKSRNIRTALLSEIYDIDTLADWQRFVSER